MIKYLQISAVYPSKIRKKNMADCKWEVRTDENKNDFLLDRKKSFRKPSSNWCGSTNDK